MSCRSPTSASRSVNKALAELHELLAIANARSDDKPQFGAVVPMAVSAGDKALAEFTRLMGFGSSVQKELLGAGIVSLSMLIKDAKTVVPKTRLPAIIKTKVLQAVENSGQDFLERWERMEKSKAERGRDGGLGSTAFSERQGVHNQKHLGEAETRVANYVQTCVDVATRANEAGWRTEALLTNLLQKINDVEAKIAASARGCASPRGSTTPSPDWAAEVQTSLDELQATLHKLYSKATIVDDYRVKAEKASQASGITMSKEVTQLLSRAYQTCRCVEQVKSAVVRRVKEAEPAIARLSTLCTKVEVEGIAGKAEKAILDLKAIADKMKIETANILAQVEEVILAANSGTTTKKPPVSLRDITDLLAKNLSAEQALLKQTLEARLGALSKLNKTRTLLSQEEESAVVWKQQFKDRLDVAAAEAEALHVDLINGLTQAVAKVLQACRADQVAERLATTQLQEAVRMSMRFDQPPVLENPNKLSIIQLSLKEKGLIAIIKDITGGPSDSNDLLGNVIRASDNGELDLTGLPAATYTLQISNEANSSIPLKEVQVTTTAGNDGLLIVEPSFIEVPSTPPSLASYIKPPVIQLSLREKGMMAIIKDITDGPANANELVGKVIRASDVGELNLEGLAKGQYTLQLYNEANPSVPLREVQVTLAGGSKGVGNDGPLTVEPMFIDVPTIVPTLDLKDKPSVLQLSLKQKGLVALIKSITGGGADVDSFVGKVLQATEDGQVDLDGLPAGNYTLQICSNANGSIPLREVQVTLAGSSKVPGLMAVEPAFVDLPSFLPGLSTDSKPVIVQLSVKEKGLVAIIKDITDGPMESACLVGSVIKVSDTGELDMRGLPMGTYTLKLVSDSNKGDKIAPREVSVTLSKPQDGTGLVMVVPALVEVPLAAPTNLPLPSTQKSSIVQLSPSVQGLIATIKNITDGPKNTAGLLESIILASDTGELDMDGYPQGNYTFALSADSDPDITLCEVTIAVRQPSGKSGLVVVEPFFVEVPVAVPDLNVGAKPSIIQLNPREKGLIAIIKNVVGPDDVDDLLEGILRASDTGELDLDGLPAGIYTLQISTDANPDFPLDQVEVTLVDSADGVGPPMVEPSSIDLNVTPMVFGFRKADQPFTQAMVKAMFVPKGANEAFPLHKVTDQSGNVTLLLPAGTIKPGMTAVRADRSVVRRMDETFVPDPAPMSNTETSRRPLTAITAVESSGFQEIVSINNNSSMAVVLGDISGSMGYGDSMPSLRRSLLRIYKDCVNRGIPVGLLAWDSWVWPCPVMVISELSAQVEEWINTLQVGFANDMRYALEEAIRSYPQASDIYVMCDGDIQPFCLEDGLIPTEDVPRPPARYIGSACMSYNNTNWLAFRQRYPDVRFHFVALSDGADSQSLQRMAFEGGGDFLEHK